MLARPWKPNKEHHSVDIVLVAHINNHAKRTVHTL
jgi:hypothetical protein